MGAAMVRQATKRRPRGFSTRLIIAQLDDRAFGEERSEL
jgi:hypothetical protein